MSSRDSAAFIALVQASAGAVGGVFATFVLQPVEVAKTRIQLTHSGDASTIHTITSILAQEGALGLFTGVGTKAFETGSKNFVYFYIYDAINAVMKQRMELTAGVKLVLGYVAGVGTAVSTMPLEVLATKVQAEKHGGGGTLAQARKVIETEGIGGLFKGFWYNIMLCINPAIQNSIFDKIKDFVLAVKKSHTLTPFEAFVLGAFAKAVASTTTYPLVRLKTILQAGQDPKPQQPPPPPPPEPATLSSSGSRPALVRTPSTGEMISAISYRVDRPFDMQSLLQRFMELYRGIGSTLTKSVLQAAVLYMTKDQVAGFVRAVFKVTAQAFFRKSGVMKLGVISGRPLAS